MHNGWWVLSGMVVFSCGVRPGEALDGGSAEALTDAGAPDASVMLEVPAGCTEVTFTQLQSTTQRDHESYARQPHVSANDGQPDALDVFIDGAAQLGTAALERTTNTRTCSNCLVIGGRAGVIRRGWVSVSGALQLDAIVTPYQLSGKLENVRLEEVTSDQANNVLPVTGGSCLWVRSVRFDTRRAGGCAPFTAVNTCGAGRFCMPTNSMGTDGQCTRFGQNQAGQACSRPPRVQLAGGGLGPHLWDSECAEGLRCFPEGAENRCRAVCDVRSTSPGCPSGTRCGGGYNLCLSAAELVASGLDESATVGTPCRVGSTESTYCGGAGLPGFCLRTVSFGDDPGPQLTCQAYSQAVSQCTARGLVAGFAAYKGGADRSTGFCYVRDLRDGGF